MHSVFYSPINLWSLQSHQLFATTVLMPHEHLEISKCIKVSPQFWTFPQMTGM